MKANGLKKQNRALDICMNNIVWILLIVSILVMGMFKSSFYSFGILSNILVQGTVLGMLALGVAMVVLLGDINLCTVGTAGFSALLGVMAMKRGLPIPLSILTILLVGGAIGLLNGVIVTKLKANAFIETLAMNLVLEGALLAITNGNTISELPSAYKYISQGKIGAFPALPLVLFGVFIIFYILWNKTSFGRSVFAIGGNGLSAYIAGINVNAVKVGAYTVAGVLSGLAGYLLSGYMGAVTYSFGSSSENLCIAAAVIGGVSLTGGKGSIVGVLGGTLLLTVIQVGLAILGIPSTMITLAGGIMIFIAVIIDSIRNMYQTGK